MPTETENDPEFFCAFLEVMPYTVFVSFDKFRMASLVEALRIRMIFFHHDKQQE